MCSNYGITTTSKAEWNFLVITGATPQQLQLERWPEESVDRLCDRSKCRAKPVLAELVEKAKPYNEQLVKAGNTALLDDELIAANMYTGPVSSCSPDPLHLPPACTPHAFFTSAVQMFIKYNGVLRGLQSESDFLKNTMVQLCCAKEVAEAYQGTAEIFQPANGSISFEQA